MRVYTEKLRPLEETEELDLSFMAAWPRFRVSFSKGEDGTIKTGLKHSKTAEEMLKEYALYKDFISNIDEALEAEAKSQAALEPAASDAEKAAQSVPSRLASAPPCSSVIGGSKPPKPGLYRQQHCRYPHQACLGDTVDDINIILHYLTVG